MQSTFCYVYVLYSILDKKFYVGCTENLKIRFEQHRKGFVASTKDKRPLELVYYLAYYEAGRNFKDARKREQYLKTTYGHRYLKKRLKSYFTGS